MSTTRRAPDQGQSILIALDDPACFDRRVAGGKAALLARAAARGLPVLPGLVVPASRSRPHLARGAAALAEGGSGRARLAVSTTPLDPSLAQALGREGARLGNPLVVRSSGTIESDGAWSGAFTSYLDVEPTDLVKTVPGCWASSFTVAAIERHRAAGVEPGAIDMAVLIQPAIAPEFAGTAHVVDDGVMVTAVAGSPVPLVQGWEPGVHAHVRSGESPQGPATELVGTERIEQVAEMLGEATGPVGATGCEWASIGDEVLLLQLTSENKRPLARRRHIPPGLESETAQHVARLSRRFPGPLGSEMVIPWALGTRPVPEDVPPIDAPVHDAIGEVGRLAGELTSRVWGLPPGEAIEKAGRVLPQLRGTDPRRALDRVSRLPPVDGHDPARLLGLLSGLRHRLAATGVVSSAELGWHIPLHDIPGRLTGGQVPAKRVGIDRWDPYNIAVVLATGRSVRGISAAGGVAFGRMRWIGDGDQMQQFRQREVIVARNPIPNLAPLLWDAAGVVTLGGSPGAHLFESARALGIPAITRVDLDIDLRDLPKPAGEHHAMVVDGDSGSVVVAPW